MSGYFARRRLNQERRVIAAMGPPDSRHFVLDLMWLLRMGAGTIYPTLARLERVGTVGSEWVQVDDHRRRAYYLRVTG